MERFKARRFLSEGLDGVWPEAYASGLTDCWKSLEILTKLRNGLKF